MFDKKTYKRGYIFRETLWDRVSDFIRQWIGFWYITLWSSKTKLIEIGIGSDYTEGSYGPFFARAKTLGPFYVVVSRPTLQYIKETEYPESELKDYGR